MFRFHETTRKRVCRAAFVLLCLAPTIATGAWIGWRRRPGLAADQSARLAAALRIDARLASWREPRPGLHHTEQLTLLHPGADSSLLTLKNVEVQHAKDALRIKAETISSNAVDLGELTHHSMGWLAATDSTSIVVSASDFTLSRNGAKNAFVCHDLQVRVQHDDAGGWKAQLSALCNETGTDADAITMTLEHAAEGKVSANLDAKEAELPCWLIAAAIPALAALNDEASFTGSVQLKRLDGELQGVAQGQITKLAIQTMLPSVSPHSGRGLATASLLDLRWRSKRIESISASVRADHLEVSASLIDAAVRSLYCKLASTHPSLDVVNVDQFACRFQFDHRGLTVTGELGGQSNLPPGCLASSQGQLLLMQPQYVDLPAGHWVQFLAAPASSWLPATREAVELAERLPLPTR